MLCDEGAGMQHTRGSHVRMFNPALKMCGRADESTTAWQAAFPRSMVSLVRSSFITSRVSALTGGASSVRWCTPACAAHFLIAQDPDTGALFDAGAVVEIAREHDSDIDD